MTVFIAVPYTRPHLGPFVASLLTADMPPNARFQHVHGKTVDLGRNHLANLFLADKDCTHLLFIDNDCTFTPGAIRRLVEWNVPMVSACMYTKDIPPHPTMGRYLGRSKSGKHYYRFGGITKDIIRYTRAYGAPEDNACEFAHSDSDLQEVDGIGMHFTLIRRDVLETIQQPFFFGETGGEDFYFCRKVRDAGFPIYYDIGLHTGHLAGEEVSFGIKELLKVSAFIPDDKLDEMIGEDPNQMWEIT